jgi:hypothetical protein
MAECENAFLNVVGEYVLVSMGVIRPEIMALRKGHVDGVAVGIVRDSLQAKGRDLSSLLQKYKLKEAGPLFWYRYTPAYERPGREVDGLLRDFITVGVRTEKTRVLAATDYPTLFAEAKEIAHAEGESFPVEDDQEDDAGGNEEEEARRYQLRSLLDRHLRTAQCEAEIRELIKSTWFPALNGFLRQKHEPSPHRPTQIRILPKPERR